MRVAELKSKIELLVERATSLERENKILREELRILKQGLFGRRTEHLEPGQLRIFEDDTQEEPAPSKEIRPTKPERPRPAGHGRGQFAANLPRDVIVLDVAEEERACSHCGEAMCCIGEEVSERLHVVPAQFRVRRFVRQKYACPNGHMVKTADPAPCVIEGGKYEASVYAYLVTSKYADHLPLNRLEGIFKRRGMRLAKQTMWTMLVRVDELVAQPVLEQMRREMLEEEVLHSDETPVTMRLEDGKGSRTCYAWGWRNLRGSEVSKVLIEFRPNRSRDGPLTFLGEWSGTLIADGYSGFDEVIRRNGLVRAGCWAHARRKLKEVYDRDGSEIAAVRHCA